MRTALRPFLALCFFACCLLPFAARADFAVEYHFTDFTQQPQANRPVYITPLWTVNAAGTNFLTPDRAAYTADASASLIVSNFSSLVSAAYRVEFYGRFSIMQFTNYFPTNLSGLVNAKDYVTLPTGVPAAYSTTDSDARYVIRAGDTAYNLSFLKPTGLSTTNTGTIGQVYKWLTSATGYWATLVGTDGIASNNGSGRYNWLTNPVVRFIGPSQTTTLTTNGNKFEIQTDGNSDYTPLSFDFGQLTATLAGFDLTVGTFDEEGSIRNYNNSGGLDYDGLYGLATRLTNGSPTLATNSATAMDGMALVKRGGNLKLETVTVTEALTNNETRDVVLVGSTNHMSGNLGVLGRFSAGGSSSAIGASSAAFGLDTFASGGRSFVAGKGNTASGLTSTAFGTSNTVLGASSFVAGIGGWASADRTILFNLSATGLATNSTSDSFMVDADGGIFLNGSDVSMDNDLTVLGILTGNGSGLTLLDATDLTGTISVNRFNGGAGADNTTYLRGDGTWAIPPGAGGGGSGSHPIPTNNVNWSGYGLTNITYLLLSGTFTNQNLNYLNLGMSTNYAATNLTGTILNSQLPVSGVGAGTYSRVTVDAKGLVTAGTDNGTAITNASPGLATNSATADDGMALVKRGNNLKLESFSPTNTWLLTGNSGLSTTNFIGNSDAVSLTLKVNGGAVASFDTNQSVILGSYSNTMTGWTPNSTIAGGTNNSINSPFNAVFFVDQGGNFIGGGQTNLIYNNVGGHEFIGGGLSNRIYDSGEGYGSIVGGNANRIYTNAFSFIGGGQYNAVSNNANYGTIPGGSGNLVAGSYGFAAGRNARAMHDGAFVWGDSQSGVVTSSVADSFTIRARGGFFLNGAPVNVGSNLTVNNAMYVSNTMFAPVTLMTNFVSANSLLISETNILRNGVSVFPTTGGFPTNSAQMAAQLTDEIGAGLLVFRQLASTSTPHINFAYQQITFSTNANFNSSILNTMSNAVVVAIFTNTASSWKTNTLSAAVVWEDQDGIAVSSATFPLPPTNITQIRFRTDVATNVYARYESVAPNPGFKSLATALAAATSGKIFASDGAGGVVITNDLGAGTAGTVTTIKTNAGTISATATTVDFVSGADLRFTGDLNGSTATVGATVTNSVGTGALVRQTVGALYSITNSWAGPTNILYMTNGMQYYVASQNIAITNLFETGAQDTRHVNLMISNSSASYITGYVTHANAKAIGVNTTNALAIPPAKVGDFWFRTFARYRTNYITGIEQ